MPRISIIIPVLNEEKFLPVLLDSIKAQTFQDYEIIVADAGSADRTADIARQAGALVVPGGMPATGRNRGAAAAKGELLFFFDADVLLPGDFLEKAVAEMDERFLDLATCEFEPQSDLRLDKLLFKFANLTVKMNQSINPRAAGFCIFISARLFRQIGGFDESLKLAEDHDLVTRGTKYRPLRVLNSCKLSVSVRRLAKEGRFALIEKYFHVEWHLLTKGNIREDIVEYEFGNFDDAQKAKAGKALDEFEEKVIQLERQYDRIAQTLKSNKIGEAMDEGREKMKAGFDNLMDSLKGLLTKK